MEHSVNQNTYINVITSLATVATARVEGVASISTESGNITNKISMSNLSKGVDVEITPNNQIILNIYINATYGYKVPELVCRIQEAVKKEVENNTMYKVKAINVNVVGVVIPS